MKVLLTIGLLILAVNALVVLMVGLRLLADHVRDRAARRAARREEPSGKESG